MGEPVLEEVILYTDGASRGNPGPAGAGWVMTTPSGAEIESGSLPLGEATNNEAEYHAVIRALDRARQLGVRRIHLRADSELLIRQLTYRYRVRNERLLPLYDQVRRLCRAFDVITFEHVPREANHRADQLASQAAAEAGGKRDEPADAADGSEADFGSTSTDGHPVRLRVRYGETDQMGVAYYANYLDWFTEGRTETMRAHGVPYRELEASGIYLPVREVYCEYLHPVRYDEQLTVYTRITRLTPVRLDFDYVIAAEVTAEKPRARGWTRHVFMDAKGRPFNLRKRHPDVWERLSAVAVRFAAADDDAGT